MLKVLEAWVPATFEAFRDYRMGGAAFSAKDLDVVKALIAGQPMTQEQSGMSKREWVELMAKLDREG